MDRYVCIHGHFYQPPRENPWLEAIEAQESAYPYHDWNERIASECYEANGASRVLDDRKRIERIVNNYASISFNFGPTLLSWMEEKDPETYTAIQEADRESQARFSGHGSALAQVYNHMILPLANRRDRRTQVIWGIRDFQHRFGRSPEGLWLAETAADAESLDILAEQGIRFTILAQNQARRTRRSEARHWRDVGGGRVDPTMPYEIRLPSGRSIAVFFYDGPISRAVAFEGLLRSGVRLANRILGASSESRSWPELLHIATDGETYGHHHRHGEMALTYALQHIENNGLARLTNYGEHLDRFKPTHQAEIFEKSSWSCAHGVDRWWSDCGCNSGMQPGWNQAWRTPLRNALDWLRDDLAPRYEKAAGRLLRDPWAARDDYIDVILDRSPESVGRFLERHAARPLEDGERIEVLKHLELQRHAMLMYTSCGWFFDELSGIETVQVIQYAGRAVQLAREILGIDPEPQFVAKLAEAKSNVPEHGDGARIYEKFVKPAMVDLLKVGAHYAVSSLFKDYEREDRIYCYAVTKHHAHRTWAGRGRLLVGHATVTSKITGESGHLSYGVLHLGDHNVHGGVRSFRGEEAFDAFVKEIDATFKRGDFPAVIRLLDHHFQGATYSLKSLFRDEQRDILHQILEATLAETETRFRQIYETHVPLMRFLADLGTAPPKALHTAAEFVLNAGLRRAFRKETIDLELVRGLLDSAASEKVALDGPGLAFAIEKALERLMERAANEPGDVSALKMIESIVLLVQSLPFEVDLWRMQNLYDRMMKRFYPEFRSRADEEGRAWVATFVSLGELLSMRVG